MNRILGNIIIVFGLSITFIALLSILFFLVSPILIMFFPAFTFWILSAFRIEISVLLFIVGLIITIIGIKNKMS